MHIPVLADKIVEYLNPEEGKVYIDATIGCGGYTKRILTQSPKSKVIGLDCDKEAIEYSKKNLANEIIENKVVIIKENYVNIKKVLEHLNIKTVDGIIFDFGMSTLQLKTSRGFSFNDETLDMRMDSATNQVTAKDVINKYEEEELKKIFFNFGEERLSRLIAKKIVESRAKKSINSAKELSELVSSVVRRYYRTSRVHPATRIFQALRIFVNNELSNIEEGVNNAIDVLNSGGKCIAVSYHSLEDRIVKNIFRNRTDCKIITKKPIIPNDKEIKENPSSRSAKLRVVEKL